MQPSRRTRLVGTALLAGTLLQLPAIESVSAQAGAGSLTVRNGRTLAQVYAVAGPATGDGFGSATAHDFFSRTVEQDLIVAAPGAVPAEQGPAHGMLIAHDPHDGTEVARVSGATLRGGPVRRFGESIGVLGHPTAGPFAWWAVGAPAAVDSRHKPVVVVFGDESLQERYRLRGAKKSLFGWKAFTLFADIDGDDPRALEFVVTAPTEGRAGRNKQRGAVYLHSVMNGQRLWRVRGDGRFSRLGYAAFIVEDRDGDDINDVWVSAPGSTEEGVPGAALLLSGVDGAEIDRVEAPAGAELFGYAMTVVPDRDGDGVRELVVGAPATDVGAREAAGRVYVLSSADGSVIETISGAVAHQWFGAALGLTSTLQGTERRLLVGSAPPATDAASGTGRGRVDILDLGGGLLSTLTGTADGDRFGAQVGGFRDLDGDQWLEVLIAAPRADPSFTPR